MEWSLLWKVPLGLCLLEVALRAVVYFFFRRHFRLRSSVEHHMAALYATMNSFNMCGVVLLQTELGPQKRFEEVKTHKPALFLLSCASL